MISRDCLATFSPDRVDVATDQIQEQRDENHPQNIPAMGCRDRFTSHSFFSDTPLDMETNGA